LGASPRASLALFHAAQALAALRGRSFVIPDDVKHLVGPTLGHRLILRYQGRLRGTAVERVLQSILDATPVPAEPVPAAAPRPEPASRDGGRRPEAAIPDVRPDPTRLDL
jgi:MoxR-like ATPase